MVDCDGKKNIVVLRKLLLNLLLRMCISSLLIHLEFKCVQQGSSKIWKGLFSDLHLHKGEPDLFFLLPFTNSDNLFFKRNKM